MKGVDIHGEVELCVNSRNGDVPCELVSFLDALRVPIGPVQLVLKHGNGKWVRQPYSEHESYTLISSVPYLHVIAPWVERLMACIYAAHKNA